MQTRSLTQTDHETEFVAYLLEGAHEAGLCFNEAAFINFYVALKSKPMVILTGPPGSGKIAAVKCLSRILMGDCSQCQWMVGHPWAFEKSENLAMFTDAHMRYNTEKLFWLIEEAWRPKNKQRAFIACLTRISPAELLSFFTDVASQLNHGWLMRLGDVRFSTPIPFPPNLFLIGTMDTLDFDWWDRDLRSMATVVQWPTSGILAFDPQNGRPSTWESEFLRSCVRQKQAVYHKLYTILRQQRQPLLPLLRIEALLNAPAIPDLPWLVDEAMLYLANSWSSLGNGLFDPINSRNLEIALDLVMAQFLLPYAGARMQENVALREKLMTIVYGQFPRSARVISSYASLQ